MKFNSKSAWYTIATVFFLIIGCDGLRNEKTASKAIAPLSGASNTWQVQLSGPVNTSYAVKVYDIDLFDTPLSTIKMLKSQGKYVICYFSAGSSENWRPDYKRFVTTDMGKALSGWPGEHWLDTRSNNVREIMRTRLDLAKTKQCDGVDPDNVDGYTNNTGFALDDSTQLDYNLFLSIEAHARRLSVGLKNDIKQIDALASNFDFAVNEQCFQYGECGAYVAFTGQGKPVFNIEYAKKYVNNSDGARDQLCKSAKAENIRTLVLPLKLDDTLRYSCD